MKKKRFKEFIALIEGQHKKSSKLYKLGVDLMEYDEGYHKIIYSLGRSLFTDFGWDAIENWLYERPEDNTPWCWEADGTEIPMTTVDDLYNHLKKNGWGIQ